MTSSTPIARSARLTTAALTNWGRAPTTVRIRGPDTPRPIPQQRGHFQTPELLGRWVALVRRIAYSRRAMRFLARSGLFNGLAFATLMLLVDVSVYRGFQVWDQYRLFMDETKPPFKSA